MIWLPDLQAENFDAIAQEHSPRVAELVAVSWGDPDSTIYYCSTQADEVFSTPGTDFPVRPVEVRFEANQFLDLPIEDGVADSSIDLDFWDADGEIARLHFVHGQGVRVEVFYYFPDYKLLLSQWHGHLGQPDDANGERFKVSAAYGFRSALLPLPRRAFYTGCQAVYGGLLSTQAEIDEGDCPSNIHLPGGTIGNLNPSTGLPFPSCPRNNRHECVIRIEPEDTPDYLALSYLGFDTQTDSYPNAKLTSTSRGNENNLKRPLRRSYGDRLIKDLDLIAYSPELDTKHPDKGWVLCMFAISDGVQLSLSAFQINNTLVGYEHQTSRLGLKRQSPTWFTPHVANYSGTTLAVGRIQGDFGNVVGSDLSGQIRGGGQADIRVYSDPETFSEQWTINRAWVLLDVERNKRWGHGIDPQRMVLKDWIDLAGWSDDTVTSVAADGTASSGTRTTFVGELLDKTAQRQITDICLSGCFTLPFPHRGKTRIMALAREERLDLCPVFTDQGEQRNIIVADNGNSLLSYSRMDDKELPNRVVVTFEDAEHDHQEHPETFEDLPQQLRAGRAFGDTSQRPVEKQYSLFGVETIGQATRLGNRILDLGPFDGTGDECGLENNLRITFTTWFTETLTLHKYKVIRVISPKLQLYGFEYFRIRSLARKSDLQVEISAQAYPVPYYDMLESEEAANVLRPPSGIFPNPGGRAGDPPDPPGFRTVDFGIDDIHFELT